jgi:ABC-type transport system involved in multi-copper enzyme maturation permease subunit
MKLKSIALETFRSFLHNRLILVLLIIAVIVVLLMMTPLLGAKAMRSAQNAAQMENLVLTMVAEIMQFVSGFGSLLAAWAAADAVSAEMTSGTIMAVMARPVKRWEFLLGKFAGVMLLMTAYVAMMLGLSFLLAGIGGQRIHSNVLVLFTYPMVRYAIWAAIAMTFVTWIRPIAVMGVVMLVAIFISMASSQGFAREYTSVRHFLDAAGWVLPSTGLLSETRFLEITHASLKQTGWLEHLTTISYGLNYALVCLLLAMWSFHYRSLKRD